MGTNLTEAIARVLVNTASHAPARFHVNGSLFKVPEFAEAFGITKGRPMARRADDRVRIW